MNTEEQRVEKEPHGFCETKPTTCTMNYCDENGCQDRKRHLVDAGSEGNEFELFVSMYPPFRACFRIGVQTFSVCERVDKKEAEWFVERLRSAFKTLEEYQLKQRDETILTNQDIIKKLRGDLEDSTIHFENKIYHLRSELHHRDETIKRKDEEIKDLMFGQDQQAVDLVRLMDQIDDQKQMEIKLYDELLKEQHKVKQLREALGEVVSIAGYYHNPSVKYTDMPYKNWNDSINKARKLLTK